MEKNEKNTKKNNIILNIGIAVIAVVVVIIAYKYFVSRVVNTYSDDARVQQLVTPINARVGGYIQDIRYDEFSEIHKGDTLVVIDPTDYKTQLELAEAGLEEAMANKEVMTATVATLENAQVIASANLDAAKARLWNAEQNYERFQQLVKENSATQQQFDGIKSEYESLNANYQAMLKAAEGAKLSTNEAKTRLKTIDAGIKKAKAGVDIAKQNLEYTVLIAPCDGLAGRKNISPGQFVQPGQMLVQLVDENEKWVTVNFLEKQMEDVSVGKKVDVKIDAFPGEDYVGIIQTVAGATGSVFSLVPTDNATGNFVKVQQRVPVKVVFSDDTPEKLLAQLRAGMNAEVYVND